MDYPPHDFYDVETEDDFLDFNNHQRNQNQNQQKQDKEFVMNQMKKTFKDKVNNIKSDFSQLLSNKGVEAHERNNLVMS